MEQYLSTLGVWTPTGPENRIRGELSTPDGENAKAVLEGGFPVASLRSPRPRPNFVPGDMGGAMLAHASRSVARFRAVTIYGELETGELVTLVDANDHGGLGLFHEYISSASVIGAHVSPEQTYRAVRFRLDDPFYTNHLRDGDASEVSDDGSVLRVETSQRGNWLVYESSEPATLRQLDIRVFSSCRALAQLALAIQVAQTAAGCWLAPPPHFGSATCALWSESWWPTSP